MGTNKRVDLLGRRDRIYLFDFSGRPDCSGSHSHEVFLKIICDKNGSRKMKQKKQYPVGIERDVKIWGWNICFLGGVGVDRRNMLFSTFHHSWGGKDIHMIEPGKKM